jgi:hypothetical protein
MKNKTIYSTLTILLIASLIQLASAQEAPSVTGTSEISAPYIGVYSDENCTLNMTSIEWGFLAPGENKTATVYVKPSFNSTITISASSNNTDVTFNSTALGATLANVTRQVNFTIFISPNATSNAFTLPIILTAEMSVIPEYPFILPIALLLVIVAASALIVKRRRFFIA